MPLIESDTEDAIKYNIRKEIAAGKSHEQAVAIAMDMARKAKKRRENPMSVSNSNNSSHGKTSYEDY